MKNPTKDAWEANATFTRIEMTSTTISSHFKFLVIYLLYFMLLLFTFICKHLKNMVQLVHLYIAHES